jgi:hypothetical protein
VSASSALQKAIVDALKAHPTVSSLVGDRVYDQPPKGADKPYISLGPSDFRPERRDCMKVRTETVQIDVWDGNQRRQQPCKEICDAVVAALDATRLDLADPYAIGRCDLILARVLNDRDGITKHGVLQFEFEVTG